MKVYERIKALRKERGLTAEQVAEAIGVSRATIYRYETKDIENMPITVLEPLAEILRCSPGYLMGWEEQNSISSNRDEEILLSTYRKLNADGKRKLLERADELLELGYIVKGDGVKMA